MDVENKNSRAAKRPRMMTKHHIPASYKQTRGEPIDLELAPEGKVLMRAAQACSQALPVVLNQWRSMNPDVGINYDEPPESEGRFGFLARFQVHEFVPYLPARVVVNHLTMSWNYAALEPGDVQAIGYQRFLFETPNEGNAAGRFVAYSDGTVEVYQESTTHMAPVAVRNLIQKYFDVSPLKVVV